MMMKKKHVREERILAIVKFCYTRTLKFFFCIIKREMRSLSRGLHSFTFIHSSTHIHISEILDNQFFNLTFENDNNNNDNNDGQCHFHKSFFFLLVYLKIIMLLFSCCCCCFCRHHHCREQSQLILISFLLTTQFKVHFRLSDCEY